MAEQRSIISSARLIGMVTLVSRITGMARDMALSRVFGAGWVPDAFAFAFQFPNLFRRLFAEGAMAAVFVPTFTRTLDEEGRDSAWQLLGRTLSLLASTLITLIVAIEIVIAAIWYFSSGDGTQGVASRRLLLSLTALMLPFMLTICTLALFSSILNCVGSFVPAAVTPMILNIVMIAGIYGLGPLMSEHDPAIQIYGVAISVLVAGAAQILFLMPAMRANGVPWRWQFKPRDKTVRRMLAMMGPVVLGQGVLLLGVFLDACVCWFLSHVSGTPASANYLGFRFEYPLAEGALTVLTYAQRLSQFPIGVLAISVGIAALPTFSRLAGRNAWPEWGREVSMSLRLTIFGGLLAGCMILLLSEPIVRLLFEYGRFTPDDTQRAGRVLTFYGLGMWAFCANHIVLRAFYSISDVRTPLVINCVLMPLNLALSLALVWFESIREAAFAISGALTAATSMIVGLIILQRRLHAPIFGADLLAAVLRMLAAAVLAMAAVWWLRPLVFAPAQAHGPPVWARAWDVFGSLGVGVAIYFLVAELLRLPEARMLLASRHALRARSHPAD